MERIGKVREKKIGGRYAVREDGIVTSGGMALAPVRGVWVSIGGERRSVAYLVARAFVPNPEGREFVRHRNGDPADNRAENLEWAEEREKGRKRGPKERRVLFGQFRHDGELVARFGSVREAAERTGLDPGAIRQALKRKQGNCGGFRWMYI